jgi:cobalt-zinc-cadmium resistance protein CzcA
MGHLRPEGKRPLLTIVIGGLGTSTLLTLFVLPTIYQWIEQRRAVSRPPRKRIMETS